MASARLRDSIAPTFLRYKMFTGYYFFNGCWDLIAVGNLSIEDCGRDQELLHRRVGGPETVKEDG